MMFTSISGDAVIVTCLLPNGCDPSAALSQLPAELAARINRRKLVVDRLSQAAAHLLVRRCLGHFSLNDAPVIQKSVFGKPYHVQPPGCPNIQFSMSHTQGAVAVAFTHDRSIGVDIETVAQPPSRHRIFEALSSAERCSLAELTGDTLKAALVSIWTLKEAVLKADGRGLAVPLDSFTVDYRTVTVQTPPVALKPNQQWLLEMRKTSEHIVSVAILADSVAPNIAWHNVTFDALTSRSPGSSNEYQLMSRQQRINPLKNTAV